MLDQAEIKGDQHRHEIINVKDSIMEYEVRDWGVLKSRIVKSVLRQQKPDAVCLQETKVSGWSNLLVKSIEVGRNLGWHAMDACGAAGVY